MLDMDESRLLDVRAIYRRQASHFLCKSAVDKHQSSSCRSEMILMAGQSLGRSACDDCDVEGATILVPVLLVADENGAKLDVSVPSTMIHCSMCGMWLVTGASTLRVTRLGRGKTRRRRASRQKVCVDVYLFFLSRHNWRYLMSMSFTGRWSSEKEINFKKWREEVDRSERYKWPRNESSE